jgi:hypothetical protein
VSRRQQERFHGTLIIRENLHKLAEITAEVNEYLRSRGFPETELLEFMSEDGPGSHGGRGTSRQSRSSGTNGNETAYDDDPGRTAEKANLTNVSRVVENCANSIKVFFRFLTCSSSPSSSSSSSSSPCPPQRQRCAPAASFISFSLPSRQFALIMHFTIIYILLLSPKGGSRVSARDSHRR